jgi:hypothetical protein
VFARNAVPELARDVQASAPSSASVCADLGLEWEADMKRVPLLSCYRMLLAGAAAAAVSSSGFAIAHCDSMDGPVVADAQRALATRDVESVLKWVLEDDEDEIRNAFEMTIAARNAGEAAREVADRHFFETVVRVHRASEGEGFTGLLPAGSTDPAIAAADQALQAGDVEELADELAAAVRRGIVERFTTAHELSEVAEESVDQGRDYVQAYVQFTHFVEAVDHLVAHGASHEHREESQEPAER